MFTVTQTREFSKWLDRLKDASAQAHVISRVDRLGFGMFGDVKYFDGIGELRINHGPGYRLYFCRKGTTIVVLLCGGIKDTQTRDIRKALMLAKEV